MQLCRFELRDNPGQVRSGIFHEGRVYETDGQNAIGVHDLGRVDFLPPVSLPPTLRVFDRNGEFAYRNSAVFLGPLAELDVPAGDVDFEVRVAAVLKDSGGRMTSEEATDFILGYVMFIGFFADDQLRSGAQTAAFDVPFAIGPFLTTPDSVVVGEQFVTKLAVKINGEVMHESEHSHSKFEEMIVRASRSNEVRAADLIAGPTLMKPPVLESKLGRYLRPGDTVQAGTESLGMLTIKLV